VRIVNDGRRVIWPNLCAAYLGAKLGGTCVGAGEQNKNPDLVSQCFYRLPRVVCWVAM